MVVITASKLNSFLSELQTQYHSQHNFQREMHAFNCYLISIIYLIVLFFTWMFILSPDIGVVGSVFLSDLIAA